MKELKRKFFRMLAVLGLAMMVLSVPALAASPKMNKTSVTITVGKKATLSVKNAGKKKYKWSSSNKKIATITQKGVVTGKSAGKTTVSAKSGKKKLSCKVIVKKAAKKNTKVSKIRLNAAKITIVKGKTYTLKASVSPRNAKNKKVTWKSSNKRIVSVSSKGVVKGIKAGTASITAKAKDGSGKKAVCKVTVVNANKVKLSLSGSSVTAGETMQMSFKATPKLSGKVTWKSSDPSVASVDGNGKVTGKKAGTVKITASIAGKSVSAKIKVNAAKPAATITGIEASCLKTSIPYGSSLTTADFSVKAIMSDGTRNDTAFSIDVTYDQENRRYAAVVSASGFTKTVYIDAENAPDTNNGSTANTIPAAQTERTVTKTDYSISPGYVYVGENLAAGQVKMTATYSDGTTENVTDFLTDFTPKTAPGSYSVTVSWKGITKRMTIEVRKKEPVLKNLSLASKRSYVYSDETPDKSYVTLKGTYDDGSTKDITDFSFSYTPGQFHKDKAVYTATYQGQTLSTKVWWYIRTEPKSVNFTFKNSTIETGANLPKSQLTVKATDYDGNITTIPESDFSIDYTPKTTAGRYSFTVSYKGFSQTFSVTVKDKAKESEKQSETTYELKLSGGSITAGKTMQMTLTVTPAYSGTITWASSDTSVATVNSSGLVTAIKEGTTTITAAAAGLNKSISAQVTVNAAPATVTDIEASCSKSSIKYGDKLSTSDFTVKAVKSDGTKADAAFTVDISYDESGEQYVAVITAEGYTKTIYVKATDIPQPQTEVTVKNVSFSLNPSWVYTGENLVQGQVKVTAAYSDGSSKEVTDFTTDFSPKDTAGTYTVNVAWNGITKALNLEVRSKEQTLKNLNLSAARDYVYSDETPDKSIAILTGTYADGSTKTITDFDMSFTPATQHKGKATVTVTYQGQTLSMQIPSYVRTEAKSVTFSFDGRTIKVGENVPKEAFSVTAVDYDGKEKAVSESDYSIDFTPKNTAGTYDVKISYKEFSQTFQVTVSE